MFPYKIVILASLEVKAFDVWQRKQICLFANKFAQKKEKKKFLFPIYGKYLFLILQ